MTTKTTTTIFSPLSKDHMQKKKRILNNHIKKILFRTFFVKKNLLEKKQREII